MLYVVVALVALVVGLAYRPAVEAVHNRFVNDDVPDEPVDLGVFGLPLPLLHMGKFPLYPLRKSLSGRVKLQPNFGWMFELTGENTAEPVLKATLIDITRPFDDRSVDSAAINLGRLGCTPFVTWRDRQLKCNGECSYEVNDDQRNVLTELILNQLNEIAKSNKARASGASHQEYVFAPESD